MNSTLIRDHLCSSVLAFVLALGLSALPMESVAQKKIVRAAYPSAERGFDCAAESDEITGTLCEHFFDSLLQYEHLARPIRLQPRAAAAMPEVKDNGATYIIRIKPGIRFIADPAFKGKPRELTAHDYAYSLKRLIDPVVKAQWSFLLEGKLKGGDELVAEAKRTGKFDYDKLIEGLQVPDPYTLVIRLKEPDHNMLYILAMPATVAVAREVVEFYGKAFAEHPVGTGPFRLKHWVRSSRIEVERNPDYREEFYAGSEPDNPADKLIHERLKGKRLPLVDEVHVFIVDEEQPRWLAFMRGEHEFLRPVPEVYTSLAMRNSKISPELAARGMSVVPDEVAWLTYTVYNLDDPILGGYKPENIALRRALSMAYPVHDEINVLEKGTSVRVHSYVPPGMAGHVNERAPFLDYNPAGAKALLDMYGYIDRDGDGWREMPDGRPLVIDYASVARQKDRQRAELWQHAAESIGIKLTFNKVMKLPDLRRQAQLGQVQMWSYGWIADYPDGENFLQLFWSKSIGGANYSLFKLPEYDRLYEQAKSLPDSPERTALYRKMVHLLWVYSPWTVHFLKQGTILTQPWLLNFRKHPFAHEPWRYLDVDLAKLPKP